MTLVVCKGCKALMEEPSRLDMGIKIPTGQTVYPKEFHICANCRERLQNEVK